MSEWHIRPVYLTRNVVEEAAVPLEDYGAGAFTEHGEIHHIAVVRQGKRFARVESKGCAHLRVSCYGASMELINVYTRRFQFPAIHCSRNKFQP